MAFFEAQYIREFQEFFTQKFLKKRGFAQRTFSQNFGSIFPIENLGTKKNT